MSFSLLYVTHPSKPEAAKLTSLLLNERLIACANYYPTESVYWWEGQLTSSTEIMTIYKLPSENWEKVRDFIQSHHAYKTPCIIRLAEVSANESYEQWIHDETK